MSKHRDQDERLRKRRRRFVTLRVQPRTPSRAGVIMAASFVFVVFATVAICAVLLHRQKNTGIATAELLPPGGDIRLATKTFDDGQAHFYRYATASGREIRFFVIKISDGVVRVALDSCELCYKDRRGYRQAGNAMVCNSCGRILSSMRIGVVQGGCNPGALESVVEGDQVVLKATSLELGAAYF